LLLSISVHFSLNADAYDPSASVFLFQKKMAKRGNAESQFKLGLMYETGSGVNNSQTLATSWYKKAARQNYKPASNRLTYLEIKKSGFKEQHKKWLKKLKDDAHFNEGEALFLLGQMYSEGTAVNKSLTRSLTYLRKAAGGNIPGSEAEIIRVEQELALLQDQYINEKEKKKTASIVVLPVKKLTKSHVKPPLSKTTVNLKKTTHTKKQKKVNPKKPRTTVKKPLKKPPITSNTQLAKTTVKKQTLTQKPADKIIIKETPHPIDTICGGRNRFSRGCR